MKINANKGTFDLTKHFTKKTIKDVILSKSNWQKDAPPKIIKNIKDTIARGNSPVKGNGRFVEYSTSYKSAITKGRHGSKKLRPVNLTLTGKMMKTLINRNTQGGFVIFFTSKLAKIHSKDGAGKSKTIRKIMPQDKEVFKKSITLESDKMIKDLLKDRFKDLF